MEVLWGILMSTVGAFLLVCATIRSDFVVYRLLVARSRLLWRDRVYLFHQVVGGILLVLGALWASGLIWSG
ncbi:hypothetical protein ACFL3H_10200 [Gemmatimonadota bacterium]